MTEKKIKSAATKTFAAFTALAVGLNLLAFVVSVRDEKWSIGGLYLIIAVMLSGALVLLWHTSKRRERGESYQWRETGSGVDDPEGEDDDAPAEKERLRPADWWRAEFDVDPLDDPVEERGRRDRD